MTFQFHGMSIMEEPACRNKKIIHSGLSSSFRLISDHKRLFDVFFWSKSLL